ncbi:hypothetical protein [Bordetella petrii]|uniref:Uncharacterized protein n=1 Tax=Bordetella petrii TaxID=94624 RepID=A0ABT7W876_9BORD|nr:hypothetical protein [Bordetella petrii]MDM9561400.1 hypothetical protein [Bordetella petrii]
MMIERGADGLTFLRLETVDAALQTLARLQGADDAQVRFPDRLEFAGELASLRIVIQGGNYHSSVPGNFARGIWGFQEELYRAVASALYNVEDLRRLSKFDYERFNLIFNVSEGSSDLEAPTSSFFAELAKGLADMPDRYKLIAIIAVAVVLTTGYAAVQLGGDYFDAQTKQAQVQADLEKERERTRQIEALLGQVPTAARFDAATAAGAKQIVKSVPDAESAVVGKAYFDRDAIVDINARAAKEYADTSELKQEFKVIAFKRPEGADIARFTLISAAGEFPAALDMSADGPFTKEQIDHFWSAVQTQSAIFLDVQVKMQGNAVKQAWIADIPLPAAPEGAPLVALDPP